MAFHCTLWHIDDTDVLAPVAPECQLLPQVNIRQRFAVGFSPLNFESSKCCTPSTLNLLQQFMSTLCGHEEQIWNAVKSDAKCARLFDCVPGMPTVTMLRLSYGPKNTPYPAMAFFFPLLRQAPSTITTFVLEGIVEDVRLPTVP